MEQQHVNAELARSMRESEARYASETRVALKTSRDTEGTTLLKLFRNAISIMQPSDGRLAISEAFIAPVLGGQDDFSITEDQVLLRQTLAQIALSRRPAKACLSDRIKTEFLPVETMSVPKVIGHLRQIVKMETLGLEMEP